MAEKQANERSRNFKDITGQRFNRLTVIAFDCIKDERSYWLCRCECGKIVSVRAHNLKSKNSKSCGCKKYHTIHGMAHSPTYSSWQHMLNRCRSKTCKEFFRYGGKGIKVCARWESFPHFLADMGPKPDGTTIDRIDNSKGYKPENCRWATYSQQNRNTSRSVFLTHDVVEFARELGLPRTQLCPERSSQRGPVVHLVSGDRHQHGHLF